MYIKSDHAYETKYKYCCLPKGRNPPIMTVKKFISTYYYKAFFSVKPRTKIFFLYSKLSKILKEIISNTPDCDLFKECCISYKDINFKGAKILENDVNPHDIFEFKKDQNVPYQITVEFRSFLKLLLSCLLEPSHPKFFELTNQEEYSKIEVKTGILMSYPVKEIMGYRTGNRTVDMVKKYTIVILEFYKPLFQEYPISEEDQEEKTLQADQLYKTSFKCNEEEKEQQSLWEKIMGTFIQPMPQPMPQPTPRYIYFKNKKISKHKSSPKKIKKSHSKHKSSPNKIKKSHSKHKSSPNKIKKFHSKHKSSPNKIKKSHSKHKSSPKK
jgi:hypothetical protein